MSCYGYGGCGPLCGPACLQCYYPKYVDGCPVVIKPGPIVPECINVASPCYGGISAPAHSCPKAKCCETTTCGCSLAKKKSKSEWVKPGQIKAGDACGCSC